MKPNESQLINRPLNRGNSNMEATRSELSSRIDDIIALHYRQFCTLSVSPDDQFALVVFGNKDLPHDKYPNDRMNRSIWRLRLTDGEATELVSRDEDGHMPSQSPDGSRIAYLSERTGSPEIWVINADNGDRTQVTRSGSNAANPFDRASLCWSANSQRIAYSMVPNGTKRAITEKLESLRSRYYNEDAESIVVYSSVTSEEVANLWQQEFEAAVYVVDPLTSASKKVASHTSEVFQVLTWYPDGNRLLARVASNLVEITIPTGEIRSLYSGPLGLVRLSDAQVRIARVNGKEVEVGRIEEGAFVQEASVNLRDSSARLHGWSYDGRKLIGTMHEAIFNSLFEVDVPQATMQMLTQRDRMVYSGEHPAGPRCLTHRNAVVFPSGGPSEPFEIWMQDGDDDSSARKVSGFNDNLENRDWPDVKVIRYKSDGWLIEALLVLPLRYVSGQRYPTLLFLHGGPEKSVTGSFNELISARVESAAHLLAAHGYAVLLPNFRGSSGYGAEFLKQLQNYQMMSIPYRDAVAGIDYLIEEGVADPEGLGVYGSSFGGQLTAWTVSQTSRFKGAVASIWVYRQASR